MSNLKFKAGDAVKIIRDTTLHGFPIGSVVKIHSIHEWDVYQAFDADHDLMLFDDDDCEAIQGELA